MYINTKKAEQGGKGKISAVSKEDNILNRRLDPLLQSSDNPMHEILLVLQFRYGVQ